MLPPNWDEPKNICTICGKWWEGNPYEYETDDHDFPCPDCAGEVVKDIEKDDNGFNQSGEEWDE